MDEYGLNDEPLLLSRSEIETFLDAIMAVSDYTKGKTSRESWRQALMSDSVRYLGYRVKVLL